MMDPLFNIGDPIENGTAVDYISHEQCMDLCMCDEDCILVYWGEFNNCIDPANGNTINCRMCRVFHSVENEYDLFNGFTEFGIVHTDNTVVGTKNATFFDNQQSPNFCIDLSVCENPARFSGTAALGQVGDGTCFDCIMLEDCPEDTPGES